MGIVEIVLVGSVGWSMEQCQSHKQDMEITANVRSVYKMSDKKLDVINILGSYPAKLKNMELEYLERQEKIDETKARVKKMESLVDFEVLQDSKNPAFKDDLSNQAKRDVESKRRLLQNQNYRNLSEELSGMERNLKVFQIDLKYNERMLSAAKALARMKEGE